MPETKKTPNRAARPKSFRLEEPDLILLERLAAHFGSPLGPMGQTNVVRLALRRLAEAELPAAKNPGKAGEWY